MTSVRKLRMRYLYYFFQDVLPNVSTLQFCWHPEGSRKLVRKLTQVFQFRRRSGRFRKLSGRLSGSLLSLCSNLCSSGRFPEACPQAYTLWLVPMQFRKVPEDFRKLLPFFIVSLQFRKIPEDTGSFPRACPQACTKFPEASTVSQSLPGEVRKT